jgi:hypothetical protein
MEHRMKISLSRVEKHAHPNLKTKKPPEGGHSFALWMRSVADALVTDDNIAAVVGAPAGHRTFLTADRLKVARLSLGSDDSAGCKADYGTSGNRATAVLGMSFIRSNGDCSGRHCGDCDGGYCKLAKHDGSFQLLNSGFASAADGFNLGAASKLGCDHNHGAALSPE